MQSKNYLEKRSSYITKILLEFAFVISVFSQIEPVMVVTRPLMYASWIFVIAWGFIKNNFNAKISNFAQIFLMSFIAFCSFCLVFGLFDELYFTANYIFVLAVPLLVTLAADMYSNIEECLLNRLAKLYLVSSIIFALWVQIVYFPSYGEWMGAQSYVFGQKNSAGQIWCSAMLIAVLFIKYKNKNQKYMAYAGAFYLFVMTAIVQCRTAILAVAVSMVAYIVSKSKHKIRFVLLLLLSIVLLYVIPFTHEFVEKVLFLSKYAESDSDLNTFSSGRLYYYEIAISKVLSSPFIGVGSYYVDCSYLSVLAESGLIGFFIIENVVIRKFRQCFKLSKEYKLIFFMMFFYMVESLLEGFPPFGPGVSSLMFWFISEILHRRKELGTKISLGQKQIP